MFIKQSITHIFQTLQNLFKPAIEIKYLNDKFRTGEVDKPNFATDGASAIDLRNMSGEIKVLEPSEVVLVPTGISVNMSNPHFAAMLLPRSGLGHKKGIILGNTVGLIDSDYTGEIYISVWNRSKEIVCFEPEERIAQLMFVPVLRPVFKEVEQFTETTERGEGGFGSSGKF